MKVVTMIYARFLGRLEAIEKMTVPLYWTTRCQCSDPAPQIGEQLSLNSLGWKQSGAQARGLPQIMPLNNIFATMLNKMGTGKMSSR